MKKRQLQLMDNYVPLPTVAGDEIYPKGVFHFNITRILERIESGELTVQQEQIDVSTWFDSHFRKSVNEAHLPSVDITKPVIQAEIRPGTFEIIDGNHRMEKAFRDRVLFIDSHKLAGEQLIPFFKKVEGYQAFVRYWNSKL